MTGVSASAPGKVVLCGEYAVLDGAPAICMAVDCRAKASITKSDDDTHRVTAPGYTSVEGRFSLAGDSIVWQQGAAEFGLVDAALQALGVSLRTTSSIELDTSAFFDSTTGEKLGIGASAALTVALAAALQNTAKVFEDALRAHRAFQHGAGSGVDIAAAVHGGLLEYRMSEAQVRRIAWPHGLYYRLVWTGVAVDTRAKLAKLAAARKCASRATLHEASAVMAAAWRSATTVLDAYPAYIEQLRQFSVDHDLGIFDAGHDQLVSDAAAAGLAYKPCGAGGGDVGVLLGRSDEQLDDFVEGRIRTLPCRLDTKGVKLEQH